MTRKNTFFILLSLFFIASIVLFVLGKLKVSDRPAHLEVVQHLDRSFKIPEPDIQRASFKKSLSLQKLTQKQPINRQNSLYNQIENLDGRKYAWGLQLNLAHQSSIVPLKQKELLLKHQGIYMGDPSEKSIYLTFDEGYENGYTPKVLDTLKKNNVQAAFFITGDYLKARPDLVKRMLDEGHVVGNHTFHHPSLPDISLDAVEKEVAGFDELYKDTMGVGFKYVRPPKGEYSEKTLAICKASGYKTVFWSFAYVDYDVKKQKGADYAYGKVMDHLHNGAIILLHAVSKDNAEALEKMIQGIKAQGYEIKPFNL